MRGRFRRVAPVLVACLLLAVPPAVAFAAAGPGAGSGFRDLGGVPWAVPYIDDLAARGIMRGVAPGVFAPDRAVTRGQLAMVVARTWHATLPVPAPAFTDVPPGSDLENALRTAWPMLEPVLGPLRAFRPAAPVERQQVFAALGRIEVPISPTALTAQSQAGYILGRFRDGSAVSPKLTGWVAAAVAVGIARGMAPGVLDPLGTVTRAQLAVMVDRTSRGDYFGRHSVTVTSTR